MFYMVLLHPTHAGAPRAQEFQVRSGDLAAGVYYMGVFNMDYTLHGPLDYSLQVSHSACAPPHCQAGKFGCLCYPSSRGLLGLQALSEQASCTWC